MSNFRGLLPAALTPMHPNGDIDLDTVATQAEYFKGVGAAGVFMNGTTAEWSSLTVDERKSLTKAWATQGGTELPVIAHVGHHCQHDAISLAEHAAECGVFGVSVIAPSYFIMETAQDIVDWCAPIAAAAGDLPFYYYDLPQLSGITIPAFDVISLAKEQISSFAGLKYSGTNLEGLQRCVGLGDYDVFWGSDENLLVGLSLGCKAGVGSTYNLALPHYLRLLNAFNSGDVESARRLQTVSLRMVDLMAPHGVIPSLKAAQGMTGFDVGECRLPFKSLSDDATSELIDGLSALGIVES